MKKVILILVIVNLITGCGLIKYTKPGYRNVKNYSERMELLQSNFPEIYGLYRQGDVVIDEMYQYYDRSGNPKVHVSYHYRYR